jgi:hypothetical protein
MSGNNKTGLVIFGSRGPEAQTDIVLAHNKDGTAAVLRVPEKPTVRGVIKTAITTDGFINFNRRVSEVRAERKRMKLQEEDEKRLKKESSPLYQAGQGFAAVLVDKIVGSTPSGRAALDGGASAHQATGAAAADILGVLVRNAVKKKVKR